MARAGGPPKKRKPKLTSEQITNLVQANQGLVHETAHQYAHQGVDHGDLVQEGNLGLVLAARRYDPERGVAFATYARHWVRARITTAIHRHLGLTLRRQRCVFQRAGRAARDLRRRGQADDEASLAATLGVSVDDVRTVLQRQRVPVHLEDWQFAAVRDESEDAEGVVERRLLAAQIKRVMAVLTPREQRIIRALYLAREPADRAALGRVIGRSRERVRQIEADALAKLRKAMEEDDENT